ncbi:epoxyqueuosine reductase [Vallitalea pronyensis]|uniref:Epoxyqueuosine reductase n=1 Tax=Vallitalea pronyensis TaxID=1348613 RepID=A0A8J8SIT6_9FIRM|nr:epoxyqueuosine reductase [Vallitalea pronyensis]QUI25270.1 epoxyqueuosine reductase [Vallitalea pronyensis]
MRLKNNSIVINIINTFVSNQSENLYDDPIVGFSEGNDPLYLFLKQDIGDFYWTPLEAYNHEYSSTTHTQLSVISFVFPQTKKTKSSNLKEDRYPSYEWSANRLEGQNFINNLMKYLVKELNMLGYHAMSPTLHENFRNMQSKNYGYASNWSERHTAFISGLGTFGLSDGLITSVGKAHRCGSVIVNMDLMPTKRKYASHVDYCLFYNNGTCDACIKRCPANAISKNGHDKILCRTYQRDIIRPYSNSKHNLNTSSCGLCQVGVPCESGIPIKNS